VFKSLNPTPEVRVPTFDKESSFKKPGDLKRAASKVY
jgi:hypothetical protein